MTDNLAKLFEPPGKAPALLDDQMDQQPTAVHDILHLAELVPIVRERLDIDTAFPDAAILAGLKAVAAKSHTRARWQAAFNSNLGHWLALKGDDLHASLNTLISLLPPPRS